MELLLRQSLEQYRQLLDDLEEIARMLKAGQAAAIGPSLESWLLLQQEARGLDAQITECGERNPEAVRSCPSFKARRALMKTLAERCGEIFTQANAHKALIKDELTRLRGGRTALSGYKTLPSKSGNRVNSRQ